MNRVQYRLKGISNQLIDRLPISTWKKKLVRQFLFRLLLIPTGGSYQNQIESNSGNDSTLKWNEKPIKSYTNVFYPADPHGRFSEEYVEYNPEGLDASVLTLRCLAFYLPQFHPIPENDLWWGKGFTEWTNVTKAVPQFVGHYQPRLPGDLGFYDLRIPENMQKQADLAAHYGLAGFCLYYYWFEGKRLLELPHMNILNNPDLNMPFCLCWANENWTRRWDGLENEILIAQNYSKENDLAIIQDLVRSLLDKRYIRIHGKPVLLIYRPLDLPDPVSTIQIWRSYCRSINLGELYLVAVQSTMLIDPRVYGFDASCDFPPHQTVLNPVNDQVEILNPNYKGTVYDFKDMVKIYCNRDQPEFKRFPGVATSWDNEARKPSKGYNFINASPRMYAQWLNHACLRCQENFDEGERLVFINAWNEWAEGAYLEPDRKSGYAYLQATSDVLTRFKSTRKDPEVIALFTETRVSFKRRSEIAIVLHLFYLDLLDEFSTLLLKISHPVDLFITVRHDITLDQAHQLLSHFPLAYILPVQNKGRDILPFFNLLPIVQKFDYPIACKLHTKKSLHRHDGNQWRNELWYRLLSEGSVTKITKLFHTNQTIGLVATKTSILDLSRADYYIDNRKWLNKIIQLIDPARPTGDFKFEFVSGSMFWFRPSALITLEQLNITEDDFEPELGQVDSTLAHTMERLFAFMAVKSNFKVGSI